MIYRCLLTVLSVVASVSTLYPQTSRPCSEEGAIRSQTGTTPVKLTFENRSQGVIQVFWLNYQGQRVPVFAGVPGRIATNDTFMTHPWLAADASGRCLGIYLPSGAEGTVVLSQAPPIFPNGVPAISTVPELPALSCSLESSVQAQPNLRGTWVYIDNQSSRTVRAFWAQNGAIQTGGAWGPGANGGLYRFSTVPAIIKVENGPCLGVYILPAHASKIVIRDAQSQLRMNVEPPSLNFSLKQDEVKTGSIVVSLSGIGVAPFSTSVQADGPWLTAASSDSTLTTGRPSVIRVQVSATGLEPGSYRGSVRIAAGPAGTAQVPVTVTVTELPSIRVSPPGFRIETIEDPCEREVLEGKITLSGPVRFNWRATVEAVSNELSGAISVSPSAGISFPDFPTAIALSVNTRNLRGGKYQAQIKIDAPEDQVSNTPQIVTITVEVLQNIPMQAQFRGQFTGPVTADYIYTFTSKVRRELALTTAVEGPLPGFTIPPRTSVPPCGSVSLTAKVNSAGLASGTYRGTLRFVFDEPVYNIAAVVWYTVEPRRPAVKIESRRAEPCNGPPKLTMVLISPPPDFRARVGLPETVEALALDSCGNPVTSGSVLATFTNGDLPLELSPGSDGRWTGTWIPKRGAGSSVAVSAAAASTGFTEVDPHSALGSLEASGVPAVAAAAHAPTFAATRAVAPGEHVTIFGSDLAAGSQPATSLPLPRTLAGTSVTLGDLQLPLLFAGPSQVNFQIPFNVKEGVELPLVVRSGNLVSSSEPLLITAAQPGIFTATGTGTGQGHIYRAGADGSLTLANPASPVKAGDAIVLYASGLGAVDAPVPAGSATPSDRLYRAKADVKLIVGGREAQILFAGLAPGFAAIFQINAIVPEGITPSGDVAVVLTTGGQQSPPVTIAVGP